MCNTTIDHPAHQPLLQIQPRKVLRSSHFWGEGNAVSQPGNDSIGYNLARTLLPDMTPESWKTVLDAVSETLQAVFGDAKNSMLRPGAMIARISLSEELQAWRDDQHKVGSKRPSKGYGLSGVSEPVLCLLDAGEWPAPLLTNAAVFGSGFANLLVGAHDAQTLYSNYCCDMGFYYEHGYHKAFPEFEALLQAASTDCRAMATLGGTERREAVKIGLTYIKENSLDEKKAETILAHKTAKLTRNEALVMSFCECSILGMAAEALQRGFETGSVVNDFAFSSPRTDAIDVGSDIYNSELFNSFLNTKDITDSGTITDEALRRVYDAYAHSGARMFTERW